jgi:hypothetical protein
VTESLAKTGVGQRAAEVVLRELKGAHTM